MKFKKPELNETNMILIMLFIPIFIMGTIELAARGGLRSTWDWFVKNPIVVLFTYLIIYAVIWIFTLFFKGKVKIVGSLVLGFIFSLMGYVSYIKLDLRGEPFTIMDLTLIGEAAGISKELSPKIFIRVFALLALYLIAGFILIKFTMKPIKETPVKKKRVAFLVGLIVPVISISFTIFIVAIDINTAFTLPLTIPADINWNHVQNGFVMGNVIDSKFIKIPIPENYTRAEVKRVYEKLNKLKSANEKVTPNVVMVMSEAFGDIKKFGKVEFDKDPWTNFRDLQKNNTSGWVTVPLIGGGTANTEFEVLTGMSVRYIRNYTNPYNPYNSFVRRPIGSMAGIFSDLGYSTTAIHTYHSWFYRRSDVYKDLGFDKFISLETLPFKPQLDNRFVDDGEINKLITSEVKRTPGKDFIFAVTMQSHGPYNDIQAVNKRLTLKPGFSAKTADVVETYSNVIYDTDEDIAALIKAVDNLGEPTLLVYYGDHIPALGADVYAELGFKTDSVDGKKTPLLIYENKEYKASKQKNVADAKVTLDLDANFLGSYVLDKIGIKSNAFMNYSHLESIKEPHLKSDSKSEEYKDMYLLQYDILHGKQYYYEFAGKPLMKDSYTLGYPIKITEAKIEADKTQNSGKVIITGEGIGNLTVGVLNGKTYALEMISNTKAEIIIKDLKDIKSSNTLQLMTSNNRDVILNQSNKVVVNF